MTSNHALWIFANDMIDTNRYDVLMCHYCTDTCCMSYIPSSILFMAEMTQRILRSGMPFDRIPASVPPLPASWWAADGHQSFTGNLYQTSATWEPGATGTRREITSNHCIEVMSTLVHWCATFFETGARLRKEHIVNDESRALFRVDVQTVLSPLSDRPRLTCNHSGMITNHHKSGQIGSSYGCLNSHAMG